MMLFPTPPYTVTVVVDDAAVVVARTEARVRLLEGLLDARVLLREHQRMCTVMAFPVAMLRVDSSTGGSPGTRVALTAAPIRCTVSCIHLHGVYAIVCSP